MGVVSTGSCACEGGGMPPVRRFLVQTVSFAGCSLFLSGCFVDLLYYASCVPDASVWSQALPKIREDDAPVSLAETAEGGFLVAGDTFVDGAGYDIFLFKADAAGDHRWTKTYGAAGEDEQVARVARGLNRDIFLLGNAGYAYDALHRADYLLIRANSTGEVLREWRFGGDRNEVAADLEPVSGGVIVLGSTESGGSGGWDMQLLRLDAEGNEVWSHTYGGAANDMAIDLVATADGGYALLGESESFTETGVAIYLVKTDANGAEQWYETFVNTPGWTPLGLVQTPDGGFAIAGDRDYQPVLLKTSASGALVWVRDVLEGDLASLRGFCATSDGGFALTGEYLDSCGERTYVAKTDGDAKVRWTRKFGGTFDYGMAVDVVESRDGAYVFAGDVVQVNSNYYDESYAVVLTKVNANGF